MASTDLSQIASFANAVEAEQIRALLEENGVKAFVDGAETQTALAYVGTALGGVKLLVTHLYSMYLLMRAAALSSKFSPEGTRRFYLAFALNLFVGFLAGLFFWVLRYGAEASPG